MEAKRQYRGGEFEFIDGNTARRLKTVHDYDRENEYERQERERHVRKAVLRKEERVQIDIVSLLFLTAAIIITSFVCVEYLQVQSNMIKNSKTIASMETEVMDMKMKNSEALERVNASVDLAYVYKVATKKLGMVHAKDNQVMSYSNIKSDFVRQYDNIPSGNKSNFLDFILKNK